MIQRLSIFAVVSSTNFNNQSTLAFSSIVFNFGGGLNSQTSKFVVPSYGLYWTHLETRTNSSSLQADISIVSTTKSAVTGILNNKTSVKDFTVLSRDDLRWLLRGEQLHVSSPSFSGQLWFLEGFDLAALMKPLIAFNVFNSATVTAPASTQPFPFNTIVVNEGGGWNSTANIFVTPNTGTYVLSVTVACVANLNLQFLLMINSTLSFIVEIVSGTYSGIDIATRSVVISLYEGQPVWISGSGTQSFGERYQLSSFKGFLMSPVHGYNYAWSIYSPVAGTRWTTLLNIGNIVTDFTSISGTAILRIPFAGIYYVSLTTTNYPTTAGILQILINGTKIHPFPDISTYQGSSYYATRSSSSMILLGVNNTIAAKNPATNHKAFMTFCGFLLYPA